MFRKIMFFSQEQLEKIYYLERTDATEEDIETAIRLSYFEKDLEMLPMVLKHLSVKKVFRYLVVKNNEFRLHGHLLKIRKF